MRIVIGGRYFIHANKNMGRRIGIEITGIDHLGYAYFREYPYKEPVKTYCDRVFDIEMVASLWTPSISQIKFIYKRRTSAFKPR